jgi:hypothetical protein
MHHEEEYACVRFISLINLVPISKYPICNILEYFQELSKDTEEWLLSDSTLNTSTLASHLLKFGYRIKLHGMCVALTNRFRTDSWLKDYEQVEKYSSSIMLLINKCTSRGLYHWF